MVYTVPYAHWPVIKRPLTASGFKQRNVQLLGASGVTTTNLCTFNEFGGKIFSGTRPVLH